MKKTFCKIRRGHWVPLAWAASFLIMGKCCFRCIAYSGGKTFHAASFGILESSLQ